MTVKQNLLLPKFMISRAKFKRAVLIIMSMLCLIFSSIGNTDEFDKATLKALYTYKFGKFTKWPNDKLNLKTGHFQYCILGQSPFLQTTIDLIAGKSVQHIPLAIKAFDSGLIPEEVLSTCHILFISKSEKYRLSIIFNRLKKLPVLTVSDIDDFSLLGGMITLTEEESKLRFQINPLALQQANISISSKIMKLAEIVNEGQKL